MLKLKIPPPIVGLATAALMWACHNLLPQLNLTFGLFKVIAYALVIIGLLIEILSVYRLFRAKTTVHPLKPERSKALVTNGLYQYSRNPMYVGMLFVLLGFGVWLGNLIGQLIPIGFVWYISKFQIKPEEQILTKLFGDEYKTYQTQVRRWI